MIRCQQCGFDNPDIHKFCQKCGSVLSAPQETSEKGFASEKSPPDETIRSERIRPESTRLDPANIQPQVQRSSDGADNRTVASSLSQSLQQPQHTTRGQPVWSAILFPSALNVYIPGMGSRLSQESPSDVSSHVAAIARTVSQRDYLDARKRYQILPPGFSVDTKAIDIELRVRDCEPSKATGIERWADDMSSGHGLDVKPLSSAAEALPFTNDDELESTVNFDEIGDIDDTPARYEDVEAASNWSRAKSHSSEADTLPLGNEPMSDGDSQGSDVQHHDADAVERDDGLSTLPAIAQLYLTVQNQLYPSLPQIHDAWIDNGCAVILLEDRNHLSPLMDSLKHPDVLPIQVLHWLHEMVELWAVVEPLRCRRSLLDVANLGVDEDQILCLKRLHLEIPSQEASLQDLGRVWRVLLQGLPLVVEHGLDTLYQDLETGTITTLDSLRDRLEDAANYLHDEIALTSPTLEALGTTADLPASPPQALSFEESQGAITDDSDAVLPSEWEPGDEIDESFSDLYGDADEAPTIVLPMRMFSLTDAGLTDIGRQRDHNEDYFSINSSVKKQDTPSGRVVSARGLYILCDGMGGHAAGEVASALAVSTLQKHFEQHWTDRLPTQDEIRAAICEANQSIFDLNQQSERQGSGRMGTTLVMMLIQDTKVAIAHVGDSRVYRFGRRTGLEQITVDHEVGQREIQRGADPTMAYTRPDAYQLTQALGPRGEKFINPDIHFLDINEDALFLLCSDGLSDNELLEQYSASHVEPMLSSQAVLETELHRLVELANQHNGHDNITVVAVRIKMRPKLQGA